jgi:hypothetical protein
VVDDYKRINTVFRKMNYKMKMEDIEREIIKNDYNEFDLE